jgi:hypothetical protein
VAAREDDPRLLDLSGFIDPDEAFRRASAGVTDYTEIARAALSDASSMQVAHMAFMAFVARARGLHEAIVREIRQENPHAVFPLLRSMAELATIMLYTNQTPSYIDTVVGIGPGKFQRKSFQAMFDALRGQAPGLKAVYAHLSDYSHMGHAGVANAMTPTDDESQFVEWTDRPHWRSANDFRVACALRAFGDLHLGEDSATAIGTLTVQRHLDARDLERLRRIEENMETTSESAIEPTTE